MTLLFTGCVSDCWYVYQYNIENKTESDLKVKIVPKEPYWGDTVMIIEKDSTKLVFTADVFEGCTGYEIRGIEASSDYGQYIIDTLQISINDSIYSKKDYTEYTKWQFVSSGATGYYSLSLYYDDF